MIVSRRSALLGAAASLMAPHAAFADCSYLYNFSSANMSKWNAALAAVQAGTGIAKIACIGDSTTEGIGSSVAGSLTNAQAGSWPAQLSVILNAAYVAAENDSLWGDATTAGTSITAYDPRIVLGSGWGSFTAVPQYTAGGHLLTNNSSTAPLSFTPANPFDTIDVYCLQNSAFSVNVDGGVALASNSSTGSSAPTKITASCAAGNHTVNIVPAASSSVYIVGVHTYLSTAKKVGVFGMGIGGGTAAAWTDTTYPWQCLPALQTIAPDLSLIDLGINDFRIDPGQNPVKPSAFLKSMTSLLNTVLASGSAVLVCPGPCDPSLGVAALQQGRDCFYVLADKFNLPLIDLSRLLGPWATANGDGFYGDIAHPSGPGHANIAAVTAKALMTGVQLPECGL